MIFVTGSAGFIGSNFVLEWLSQNEESVISYDKLTYAGNIENLDLCIRDPRHTFIKGDICDLALVESLLDEHEIDTVVQFAAESHVDRSISGPDAFVLTNIVGTHTLLKAVRKHWLEGTRNDKHLFHHISTDEVYGTLTADGPKY